MRYIIKFSRLTLKRFGLFASASLLAFVTVIGLLQISAPTQAQSDRMAQAQSARPAPTDAVLDWNAIAQTATLAASAPPPQQFRTLAIVHGAIFDAVNAIEHRYTPYQVEIEAPAGASAVAAVAGAGHGVLTRLYPSQKATLDAALTDSLAKIPDGQAKIDGINVGKEVAEKLVAIRSTDSADRKSEYQAQKAVGIWQPTPPLLAPALLPHWSQVTPFVIKRADQFKIAEPLPLNSDAYAKELDEVKRLGGRYSRVRTADQTAAAIFSAISPVPLWNTSAKAAAVAKGNSLIENARLFALLNFAAADAYIAGYEVKYKYKLWRPVTAIPRAAELGNRAIAPDPNWEPLLVTPAHPDYISGHCVTAGAAERVLQRFFGSDAVKVSLIFPANAGVTRSYTSFSQISQELGESRIWAGLHTRTADKQGDVLGKQVGDYVFQNALQPLKS